MDVPQQIKNKTPYDLASYLLLPWLAGITDSMDMYLGKFLEMVRDREAWHAAVHGFTKSWT